jgi:cytochrome c-type biogenesis protein CcmH/NrfG
MTNRTRDANSNPTWRGWQAYIMAVICLLAGVLVGYFMRGSAPATPPPPVPQHSPIADAPQQMPSLEDMKRLADKQAESLLANAQSDPKNPDLLNQIGNIYRVAHQFQTAESYYNKALEANPRNVSAHGFGVLHVLPAAIGRRYRTGDH